MGNRQRLEYRARAYSLSERAARARVRVKMMCSGVALLARWQNRQRVECVFDVEYARTRSANGLLGLGFEYMSSGDVRDSRQ